MNSLGEECTPLKRAYDDCFNAWYAQKFLRGDYHSNDCDELFKVYQDCVVKALKAKKGLTVDELNTMVGHPSEHATTVRTVGKS